MTTDDRHAWQIDPKARIVVWYGKFVKNVVEA